MQAKSIKANSPEEVKNKLSESMVDGFRPTLAFVFISIKQNSDAVRNILDEEDIQIFGATSCGEFIDGDIGTGSIALMLVDMDPSSFRVLLTWAIWSDDGR